MNESLVVVTEIKILNINRIGAPLIAMCCLKRLILVLLHNGYTTLFSFI